MNHRPSTLHPAWNRRAVNITPFERIGRMIIGVAGMVVGGAMITGAGTALAMALWLLFILAGADLLITGALGHRPLYAKFGHVRRELRSRR